MSILIGAAIIYGMITYVILKMPGDCGDFGDAYQSGSGSHHQ
jgi:hypothetical protein